MVEYFSQILIPDFLVILTPKEWKQENECMRGCPVFERAAWLSRGQCCWGALLRQRWLSPSVREWPWQVSRSSQGACACLLTPGPQGASERKPASWRARQALLSVVLFLEIQACRQDILACLGTCTLAVRGTWDLCPPLPWQCPSWAGPSREKSSARPLVPNHNPAVSAEAVPAPFTPSTAHQCMSPPIRAAACLPGREATSAVCVFSACRAKGLTSTSALGPQVRRLAFPVFKTR